MKLKLVGAKSFSCPPKGFMTPILQNESVEVSDQDGEYLKGLLYKDALGNKHLLFSEDADAEVVHKPNEAVMSLEEAIAEEKATKTAKKAPAKRGRPRNT